MHDDGFKKGLSGRSILSTNDTLGWVAGDSVRKMNEASLALTGEEDPHAYQIFILMGVTGAAVWLASESGWNPFGYLGLFINWRLPPSCFTKYSVSSPAGWEALSWVCRWVARRPTWAGCGQEAIYTGPRVGPGRRDHHVFHVQHTGINDMASSTQARTYFARH